MPQIAESGNETLVEEATCVQSRNLRNDNNGSYVPSFTSEFWDGSSSFNDSKSGSDNDEIMFSTSDGFETQVYILAPSFLILKVQKINYISDGSDQILESFFFCFRNSNIILNNKLRRGLICPIKKKIGLKS